MQAVEPVILLLGFSVSVFCGSIERLSNVRMPRLRYEVHAAFMYGCV